MIRIIKRKALFHHKYQSLDEIIEKKLDETERLLKGVDLSILKMTHL